ncbi:hypothetical protein [Clostridium tarantellae]|uniref:Uncharacterized protein n=1 Tax=Clostridium tarantellae TaxID=39493 RepID=A0A6I1MYI4_9CLOT|nr:hypothetical protein [Clostridium tarantellae]MPQ45189.1 hypothetical protein [Clostridium tarantellae]
MNKNGHNERNNTSIIEFKRHVIDVKIDIPENPENTYKSHLTGVAKSWIEHAHIDKRGIIWVDTEKMHTILRTSKSNAKYILNNVSDKNKIRLKNIIYVCAYEIGRIIDEAIQSQKSGTKLQYLRYSEKIYKAIRDCDCAENLRNIYCQQLEDNRKTLKKKRINKYKIKFDELTEEVLIKKTAEFSHIRSYALFNELGNEIENGLIVNKETHKLITKEGINDENELLILCNDKGWNINWYEKFKKYFNLK